MTELIVLRMGAKSAPAPAPAAAISDRLAEGESGDADDTVATTS